MGCERFGAETEAGKKTRAEANSTRDEYMSVTINPSFEEPFTCFQVCDNRPYMQVNFQSIQSTALLHLPAAMLDKADLVRS